MRMRCSAASRIEPDETPVAVTGGGEVLRNPSNAELGRAIGLGSAGLAASAVRRRRRGCGAGRARRRPLRGLGGPRRSGRRRDRIRRSGRHLGPDRELSRLSGRGLRQRADPESNGPGGQVRGAAERAGRGRGAEERARQARDRALERRDSDRPQRHRRHRAPSTAVSMSPGWRNSKVAASTTPPPRPRRSYAPATRS